jgi:hypothetical protein
MREEKAVQLGPREQQIAELLLQGCDNDEIAKQLNMARRTVKAHFNRLFLRFGITGGIKRVKLATLLYRRQQQCSNGTVSDPPVLVSSVSSSSSLKDSKTARWPKPLEPQNTSSRITSESSMTNSDSGTGLNSLSGTKLDGTRVQRKPEELENWEKRILGLNAGTHSRHTH